MLGFQANNCRLCQKVFCCKQCRIKHEKSAHKVFPGCDICVYGKFLLENFDDLFLKHLESSHLPVHCVYCKKVFSSVEELLQHKKCDFFQTKDLSPKTPFKSATPTPISTDDHDSPIIQELQRQVHLNYILATSTPMQRGEEPNLMFEKSKEVITPVDKPSRQTSKSIIKMTDSAKKDEQLSKRRVTFGETPGNTFEKNKGGNITVKQDIVESLDDKKSNENLTPVTDMSTGQFYSAKTDISSKPTRNNSKMAEEFTPVGIPTKSKLMNVKGDIYKTQDQELSGSSESKHIAVVNNEEHLKGVLMDLPPQANNLNPVVQDDHNDKGSVSNDIFSMPEHLKGPQENETNNGSNFCTPAKASNPGKIVVKSDIYKDSEQENISLIAEVPKQNEESGKNDIQLKSGCRLETEEDTNAEGYETLWLSAINPEETNDSEQYNDENKEPDKKDEPAQEETAPLETAASPQRTDLNIVMPTPILKTTNVQMKFHFPSHLSSTPIMLGGAEKLNETTTNIIKDTSTTVLQQQNPYKLPQGKLWALLKRKLVMHQNIAVLLDSEAGPSTSSKDRIQAENMKEDHSSSNIAVCSDVFHEAVTEEYEASDSLISSHDPEKGVSVSSMTESNLWSSMTRIVRSVLGGFSNISQDSSNISTTNNSSSFKRHLSDSDTGDFIEAPRLKRFKFTDIKCRRAIRDLPVQELTRSLPTPGRSLVSFETMKTVSTLYGRQTMRIRCDKATQTDNYLMYGWHPDI